MGTFAFTGRSCSDFADDSAFWSVEASWLAFCDAGAGPACWYCFAAVQSSVKSMAVDAVSDVGREPMGRRSRLVPPARWCGRHVIASAGVHGTLGPRSGPRSPMRRSVQQTAPGTDASTLPNDVAVGRAEQLERGTFGPVSAAIGHGR